MRSVNDARFRLLLPLDMVPLCICFAKGNNKEIGFIVLGKSHEEMPQ